MPTLREEEEQEEAFLQGGKRKKRVKNRGSRFALRKRTRNNTDKEDFNEKGRKRYQNIVRSLLRQDEKKIVRNVKI